MYTANLSHGTMHSTADDITQSEKEEDISVEVDEDGPKESSIDHRCDKDTDQDLRDEDGPSDGGLARYPYVAKVVNSWPRTWALFLRIVFPLWLLIGISLGFGHLLGQYEEWREYANNDRIARNRFVLSRFDSDRTFDLLYNMSTLCIDHYTAAKGNSTNISASENNLAEYLVLNRYATDISFPDVVLGFEGQAAGDVLTEIQNYTATCSQIALELAQDLINFTIDDLQSGVDDLTFNWIRCWNSTLYGDDRNPFKARKDQIVAANNQSAFYHESWRQQQELLYKQYLEKNNCAADDVQCIDEANEQSIYDATGSGYCSVNTGGSAWFWFTGKVARSGGLRVNMRSSISNHRFIPQPFAPKS
jgi:hypothetical protein